MTNIFLPNFLYYFNDSKSKSISPTASFSPAGALSGNPFQNSSSPSKSPTKKTIIIEKPLYYGSSFTGNTIAFIKKLKILGFDVQLCLADAKFHKVDDDLNDISKLLPELATFDPDKDYQSLGIARQNVEILDNKKIEEITDCFRRESVSDDEMSSIDGFEAIVPLERQEIQDGDFKKFLFALQNAKIGDKLAIIQANESKIENYTDLIEIIRCVPPQMAEVLIEQHQDKIKYAYQLAEVISAAPQMAEVLIKKHQDKIESAYQLVGVISAAPQMAEVLIEQHQDKIEDGRQLVGVISAAPQMAEVLIKKHQDKIESAYQLAGVISAAPQMAEELIKKYQDKIEDGRQLAEVISAAPQMAEVLIEQHQDKIEDVYQLIGVIKDAPQMAEVLIKKHQDKIESAYQLAGVIKAAPQMAEVLIKQHQDKIEDAYQLAEVIKAAPQMAEVLIEQHKNKIADRKQLLEVIKAAPQMTEELIKKYQDKIKDCRQLAEVIKAAPQLTKKLPEFASNNEGAIVLPDGVEQDELKRAVSYKNKEPKPVDAPKATSKQDYQEEESSARPTCLAIPMFNIDSQTDKNYLSQNLDFTTIKIYGVNANDDAKKQEVLSFLIEVCQRNKNIKHLILPIELASASQKDGLKFPDSVGVDYINYNNYLGLPTVQKENDNFGKNWNSSGNSSSTDIGISEPSSKPDNKIRIADNGLGKTMEAASGEKSTFQMVSAGEVLNGYSDGLQIRTGIIKRNISQSFDQEHYVPEDGKYEKQEVRTIHDVNLYKREEEVNDRFCLFKQSLEAGQRYRLLSSSASEKFIGILNDKSGITIEKGDDGFFYATSTSNRVLEYIVSSPFQNPSLDNLDQNNPIRKIIEEYKNEASGYKDIADPHEKLEEPEEGKHTEWLEKVYQDRSGSCRHRVAAVEYKLSQTAGIIKDQYRVVDINNNHVILEVKNQNNDGWIPIDLGGAAGKLSNVDNDKAYSGGAINKGEGLEVKELKKRQKEKQPDQEEPDQEEPDQEEPDEQERDEGERDLNPNPELEELEINRIKSLQESFDKLLAPKETIQSTEELLKNTLYFQPQDKREEEVELEPKPENNKKGKKILITTNNKESITNHANFLIKEAIADNHPVFYIDSPDKIDIKPKIDQENPPKHLFIDENGNPTLRIIGLLEKFLQENRTNENSQKPLIIINWESFSPSEKLALNTLVDENKTINGVAIADHIEIIGLTCGDQKDHSFISRHNKYLKSSVSPNDLNKVVNTGQNPDQESQDQTEIDLQGFPRWKEELFGKVVLQGDKMVWQKSPFVQALENNKTNFKISNLLPEAIEELKYQIANAKAQGHFLYHGYKINIPQNLKIDFNAKAFDFAKFNQADVIEISTNQTRDLIPENTHLVNSYLFDHLLQDKEIKDGKYEEKAGLIELASNKDVKLFITSDLSQNQWYCLFEQAKQRGVKLDLYLAPEVKIPTDIKFTKKEEVAKLDRSEKEIAQEPRIFISNNTNETVQQFLQKRGKKTPIIIDIEDFGYQDFVKRTTFTTGENNFEKFQEIKSDILERLEKELNAGNQVIIKGQFSTDLLKMLEPLIAGLDPQFANVSQNLILIIEEKANNLPKENSIYKPLKWLPRSSYIKHECATESKEVVSGDQEYHESKPTEELNLYDSQKESEAFIKARKNQFLELLGKSPMLQLVGHSGVGKSRLLKMLEEANEDKTNVYRELVNFENWAKDKNKINKILFIDESNIEDIHFTSLSGLLKDGKKEILYKGKIYELDENHKVVFAFNPVEYGGGRFKQKLFDTYQIPKIYLEDFPASYIYEKILKEAVYDKSGQDIKDAVSEKDFQKKAVELIKKYQETNKNPDPKKHLTVRELQEQALSYLSKEANKNKVKTELKSKNFISTLATKKVEESLQSCLDIRKQQRDGSLPSDGIGINGVLLEGASGTGKSEMIIALLESREIKLVDKDHDEKSNNQVCYKIDASMPLMQKTDIIIRAFENGDIIWIDEINSCIDDGLEKILNAVLTGQHPRSSDANIKPGFTLLASANSLNLEGRSAISPALRHRLLLPEVKELKEYSPEDLTKIVSHWIDQDEELKQKISDQEVVNQKVIVAKNIANDFHELLQKPENSNLNLRMLKKMMPEKVLLEEYLGNLIDNQHTSPKGSVFQPSYEKIKEVNELAH